MERDQCGYEMLVSVSNNTVKNASLTSISDCYVPVVVPSVIDTESLKDKEFEQLSDSDLITYWTTLTGGVSSYFTWSNRIQWN